MGEGSIMSVPWEALEYHTTRYRFRIEAELGQKRVDARAFGRENGLAIDHGVRRAFRIDDLAAQPLRIEPVKRDTGGSLFDEHEKVPRNDEGSEAVRIKAVPSHSLFEHVQCPMRPASKTTVAGVASGCTDIRSPQPDSKSSADKRYFAIQLG